MYTIDWTSLAKSFNTEHLITPLEQCFTLQEEQLDLQAVDYDSLPHAVVPIMREGKITGLVRKETRSLEVLTYEWLIAHDAAIGELAAAFIESGLPTLFVLKRRAIIGLVTLADLNKLPTRVYLYNLLGELELSLAYLARDFYHNNFEAIISHLGEQRRAHLEQFRSSLQAGMPGTDLLQYLYLADLVTLVQRDPELRQRLQIPSRNAAEDLFSGLVDLRNQTMHPTRPLLERFPDDFIVLRDRINRIINILERINPNLSFRWAFRG